jgi:hypothetical protein
VTGFEREMGWWGFSERPIQLLTGRSRYMDETEPAVAMLGRVPCHVCVGVAVPTAPYNSPKFSFDKGTTNIYIYKVLIPKYAALIGRDTGPPLRCAAMPTLLLLLTTLLG